MVQKPLNEPEILARLLYRDAMLLVLDKPAGIAVHVTGHDTVSFEHSFHHLQFGLPKPPALAHRLDRGTSGCLVLGRHRQALIKLSKLFEMQKVEKTYRARVLGTPTMPEGVIDRAILKTGKGSQWHLQLAEANTPGAMHAVTHYRVVAQHGDFSEILFFPKTGRTHQIRLHAAYALGCPILGDPFYGPKEKTLTAQAPMMLHAESVTLPLYTNKSPIAVTAPLPEYWTR